MIACTDLVKRFPGRVALDGLTLSVSPGETVALLGSNGAGKTTLLRVLAGRLTPDGGTARVNGIDPSGHPQALAPIVGASLSPSSAWVLRLDALANLELFGVAQGLSRGAAREAAAERLASARLTEDAARPVGTYSAGMRARLAVARALLLDPPVLLLDEPGAALDRASAEQLAEQLSAEPGRRTVLFSTHLLEDAAAIAGRAVILNQGALSADMPIRPGTSGDDLASATEEARCA